MSDDLTPARLGEIVAAAEEATPGPWKAEQIRGSWGALWTAYHRRWLGDLPSFEDAEHIAMMDPAATLALVAEVRELRAKVERVRGIIGPRELLDPHQGGCEGLADEMLLSILDAFGEEV
ncbi:hypothetical protein [Dermacoccus sp. GAS27A]|uniref:hypothetical protein n=1 Tax=Dermacoccus sp. GAS27A TaxID=3156270 RepID=UPI003837B68A